MSTAEKIPDTREYLSEREVYDLTGVPPRTLQAWRYRKQILPFTKIGDMVRYPRKAIIAYLEKSTVEVSA